MDRKGGKVWSSANISKHMVVSASVRKFLCRKSKVFSLLLHDIKCLKRSGSVRRFYLPFLGTGDHSRPKTKPKGNHQLIQTKRKSGDGSRVKKSENFTS